MKREHKYNSVLIWTGNTGKGTETYQSYDRSHEISLPGKSVIKMSSDPVFKGDKSRYNPEELLVISLSSCHMLWYLHLCADAGINVIEYRDEAVGVMEENDDGSGQFREVLLRPRIKVSESSMIGKANELHEKAHSMCFIARSCNFPVKHQVECCC